MSNYEMLNRIKEIFPFVKIKHFVPTQSQIECGYGECDTICIPDEMFDICVGSTNCSFEYNIQKIAEYVAKNPKVVM